MLSPPLSVALQGSTHARSAFFVGENKRYGHERERSDLSCLYPLLVGWVTPIQKTKKNTILSQRSTLRRPQACEQRRGGLLMLSPPGPLLRERGEVQFFASHI